MTAIHPTRRPAVSDHVGFRIPTASIGFAFWFLNGIEIMYTALFFRDDPKMGTLFSSVMSLLFLYVLVLLIWSRAVRYRKFPIGIGMTSIVLFMGWSGLSLIWTQATPKSAMVLYWFVSVVDICSVWLMMHLADVRQIALRSIQGYVVGIFVTLSTAFLMGWRDSSGRLGDEAFLHPNTLGYKVAVACLFAIFLMTRTAKDRKTRLPWLALAGILGFGMVAVFSKTAIAAFIGGVAIFLLKGRIGVFRKSALIGAALVAGVIASGFLASYWENYVSGNAGKNLDTLTGRTAIWEKSWEMIKQQPIQGHGYFAYRDVGPEIGGVRQVHAHNEAINLLFNVGIVGLAIGVFCYLLVVITMLRANRGSRNNPDDGFGALGLALLVFILMRGLTEAGATSLLFPVTLMVLFFAWERRSRIDREEARRKVFGV